MLRLFLLLVLCSALTAGILAQDNLIRFERISSEQGLSQNVVISILEDSRGFMWFGTQNGLNRFDGYEFSIHKHSSTDSLTLPATTVKVIYEDRSGTLWVGTEGGGLSRFNRKEETFTRFPYVNDSDPNPGRDIDIIQTIHEDRNGVLWIGTWGGLLRYEPAKAKGGWSRFVHKPGIPGTLSHNKIRSFYEDHRGVMWIGTEGGGLNAFNPKTETFSYFKHQPDIPDSLSHDTVYAVIEDKKGDLWVGTNGGLDKFDRKTKRFTHFRHHHEKTDGLSHNRIRTLFEDKKGELWIGTEGGGLNKLKSLSRGTFIHYRNQPNNPYSLSHNAILSIMEDRTGAIWIGTFGGGINRIDPQKQKFVHYFGVPNDPHGLSSNDVASLYEDSEGILWVGTYDNVLNRYDPSTGKFKLYNYSSIDPESLSSSGIMAIQEEQEGALWVGIWGGGIYRLDRDTGKNSRYKHRPGTNDGPGSNYIFCFSEDRDNNFWIGTWRGGLNRFLREKNEFLYYKNDPGNPDSISSNSVTTIYPDRENSAFLWVGTYNRGLDCFNRDSETFEHYTHDPKKTDSLRHNSVQSIYISPNHPEIIWVGTYDGGLNKFDKKSKKWQSYTEDNGLPSNTIYGILEDNNKNLWLSTIKGLSRFNPETGEFNNYDVEDGLQHNEFSQGAFYKGRDGRFYFGGINGFNAFIPENITQNPNKPPVVITTIKIYSKNSIDDIPISESEEITLSYKDYVFSFEFAALNYTAPAKNQYEYKMEGFRDDWIRLGHKRDITFTGLAPEEYIFRVRGSNNDGVWSDKVASIKVIITPPFYKTLWFRILMLLMLGGIVLGLYKQRVRQYKVQRKRLETEVATRTQEIRAQKEIIEEKKNQLEISNRDLKKSEMNLIELNATKDKFFSIISHDLRNPLTALMGTADLLSISFEQLSEEKKQKYIQAIIRSANNISDLLENLLHWSRTQTEGLHYQPEKIDLAVIIPQTLSLYKINAKKKKIDLFSDIPKNTLAYADKNMVTTVLRNLISNAIKFTYIGGKIQITANGRNEFVEIAVVDSGVGISDEKAGGLFKIGAAQSTRGTAKEKGTGLGLILCKEFVEINNGSIWFENPAHNTGSSEIGKGSIFKFTLPKPQET